MKEKSVFFPCLVVCLLVLSGSVMGQSGEKMLSDVQSCVVKIYGSGGFANLHSYQTGIVISKDGLIVTPWSHVLDGEIVVVNESGKRFPVEFAGMDPRTEIALLKAPWKSARCLELSVKTSADAGLPVLGISNLFGIATKNEKMSVLSGIVSARCELNGKLGRFDSAYRGEVIVLDLITNNPGAAGGAIVNLEGDWIGMIGKELKDQRTNLWLNFCFPVATVREAVERIRDKKNLPEEREQPVDSPFRFGEIGLRLIPAVLPTTRPYVDRTDRDSVARKLGFRADDLIVMIDEKVVRSISAVETRLGKIDRDDSFTVTVKRGDQLLEYQVSRGLADD